jgi:hypothetical protein
MYTNLTLHQSLISSLPNYVKDLFTMLKGWKKVVVNNDSKATVKTRKILNIKRSLVN